MGIDTKIEWAHHTFNHVRGCTKVSQGCKFCYAETMSGRNPAALGQWGPQGTRAIAAESYWQQPLRWDKAAAKAGERHRVFCASLADVFEGPETMPADSWEPVSEARARLFRLIEATPNLDWLLLTKRPQNIRRMLPPAWLRVPRPNVWLGTSVENQETAEERIPHLLSVPAVVRFLSCEPLLGELNLVPWLWRSVHGGAPPDLEQRGDIHWVIAGGESGSNARPMETAWAKSLRDQCSHAEVSFFMKQMGSAWAREYGQSGKGGDWDDLPEELQIREIPVPEVTHHA